VGAGEAEELPQHGQSPLAGPGQGGQEPLDVVHVHQRSIVLALVGGQGAGEIPEGDQSRFQGVIAARAVRRVFVSEDLQASQLRHASTRTISFTHAPE
jgi:hypothetical protein